MGQSNKTPSLTASFKLGNVLKQLNIREIGALEYALGSPLLCLMMVASIHVFSLAIS